MEEKYISIEYNKWNDFYKPLEENYKKLQNELQDEKANKKMVHYISLDDYYDSAYSNIYNLDIKIPEELTNQLDYVINFISWYIVDKIKADNTNKSWFSKLFS